MDYVVEKVDNGQHLWILYDELMDDFNFSTGEGFFANRDIIADRFKDETLYTCFVDETKEMFNSSNRDPIFCKNSFYMLPCICTIKDGDTCELLWVHPRARNRGIGRAMIKQLNIKKAANVLSDSKHFWDKLNIEIINTLVF